MRAATLALVLPALTLIGCAMPKSPPETTQQPYRGPKVTLEERLGKHAATFECPTPGWSAVLDQVRDAPNEWINAFVTLRRPSPMFVYSQVITRQEVSTEVTTGRSLRLFVRVHDNDGGGADGYDVAGEAPAKPAGQSASQPASQTAPK